MEMEPMDAPVPSGEAACPVPVSLGASAVDVVVDPAEKDMDLMVLWLSLMDLTNRKFLRAVPLRCSGGLVESCELPQS